MRRGDKKRGSPGRGIQYILSEIGGINNCGN